MNDLVTDWALIALSAFIAVLAGENIRMRIKLNAVIKNLLDLNRSVIHLLDSE